MAATKPAPIATDRTPSEKARRTATWAKTMTKVVISQNNRTAPFWHVVNFLGVGKSESTGVIDLLAIRKNHSKHALPLKKGDLLEIVLIQVKGGSAAMPTSEDRERLRLVGKAYGAKAILLSEWKKGSKAIFSRLVGDAWVKVEPDEIFSPSKNARKKAEKTCDSQEARQSRFSISLDDVVITASPKLQSIAAKKAWITRRAGKKVDKKL